MGGGGSGSGVQGRKMGNGPRLGVGQWTNEHSVGQSMTRGHQVSGVLLPHMDVSINYV